jgi:E3 ubiquitin-protein ligase HUWE1
LKDLEVLEVLLRFLLRPAQRMSSQRSLRANYTISQEKMLTLAQNWGFKQVEADWTKLSDATFNTPDEASTLSFQFYRPTSISKQDVEASNSCSKTAAVETPITPTKKTQHKSSVDGCTLINFPKIHQSFPNPTEAYVILCSQYSVPGDQRFSFFHRIRVADGLMDFEKRQRLLKIRVLAISILGNCGFCISINSSKMNEH